MTNVLNVKTAKDITELKNNYQALVQRIAEEIMETSLNFGEAIHKCQQLDYESKWRGLADDVELEITEIMYATQINE
ncbi:hypothetical protein CD117_04295 [Mammaliicoccus sciuri]|uniref:Uncharacterized protein n=1 Tax=Mammaliicoccus sciuri TaxID=1296 RepID=A0AAJ4SIR0_MAMSC|nr:hypothetical protein [Mammaliicoccus sciuri]RTX73815.1 hypothetical protein CD117_04295 [Mammaliicoccus sciuri]